MVKGIKDKGSKPALKDEFIQGANKQALDPLAPHKPKDKKSSDSKSIGLYMNAYTYTELVEGARLTGRSLTGFIRYAIVQQTKRERKNSDL